MGAALRTARAAPVSPHDTRLAPKAFHLEDAMKKLAIAMASVFTVIAPVAHAAYDRYGNWYNENAYAPPAPVYAQSYRERQEFARVFASRPVKEAANRREECWTPPEGPYGTGREI